MVQEQEGWVLYLAADTQLESFLKPQTKANNEPQKASAHILGS
jgi:hypothetical protein